jgi:hypothetical protein
MSISCKICMVVGLVGLVGVLGMLGVLGSGLAVAGSFEPIIPLNPLMGYVIDGTPGGSGGNGVEMITINGETWVVFDHGDHGMVAPPHGEVTTWRQWGNPNSQQRMDAGLREAQRILDRMELGIPPW